MYTQKDITSIPASFQLIDLNELLTVSQWPLRFLSLGGENFI